jgi:protein phosphatase
MEKIAVISDIHGNMPAFEAVLKDIKGRGIKRIFCLGDLVGKGPHPEKAVDACREICQAATLGNWDFAIADGKGPPFLNLGWHRERLGVERLDYLKNLPPVINFYLSGRKVRLFHASQIGVFHRVHMRGTHEDHVAMFTNTDFTGNDFAPDTVGYGDIHHTYYKSWKGNVLFNAGSVGNALDEPTAAYVILEGNYGDNKAGYFSFQIIRLSYDKELAIQQAQEEGMPDWEPYAAELRTAVYRGLPGSEDPTLTAAKRRAAGLPPLKDNEKPASNAPG